MKAFLHIMVASLAMSLIASGVAAESAGGEADQLVRIKSKTVDRAYLLPGADFSVYKKVMIAPSAVAFQKSWLRNMNSSAASLQQRVGDAEANRILQAARSGFDEIWVEAFKKAGYQVVTEPGADVLQIVPSVFDLYINAPDITTSMPTRIYTVETGEASLALDARDSLSGTLLGRAIDHRTAGRHTDRLEWTTRITNRSDFRRLFAQWAQLSAEGLGELAKASPLPEKLRPGQKLPKGHG